MRNYDNHASVVHLLEIKVRHATKSMFPKADICVSYVPGLRMFTVATACLMPNGILIGSNVNICATEFEYAGDIARYTDRIVSNIALDMARCAVENALKELK